MPSIEPTNASVTCVVYRIYTTQIRCRDWSRGCDHDQVVTTVYGKT